MEENDSKFYWKGRSDPQIAVKEDITTMYHPDRFVFYIKILLKSAVCLHIFLLNSQFVFYSLYKRNFSSKHLKSFSFYQMFRMEHQYTKSLVSKIRNLRQEKSRWPSFGGYGTAKRQYSK